MKEAVVQADVQIDRIILIARAGVALEGRNRAKGDAPLFGQGVAVSTKGERRSSGW